MKLGKYHMGQNVSEVMDELTEVSPFEYTTLGRSFKDERIFHGRDIGYLDAKWRVVIGVAGDRVYKVALQTDYISQLFGNRDQDLWQKVYSNLNADYGMYTKQFRKASSFFTIWDREWGNIILTSTMIGEGNLDPTSVGRGEVLLDLAFTGNFAIKKSNFWKKIFQ